MRTRRGGQQVGCGTRSLLYHFIGAQQVTSRYRNHLRLRGLEIDDHRKTRRQNDRQLRWLGSLENPRCVNAELTKSVGQARSVAHETTGGCEFSSRKHRWDRMILCKRNEALDHAIEDGIGFDDDRLGTLLYELCEGRPPVCFGRCATDNEILPNLGRRALHFP